MERLLLVCVLSLPAAAASAGEPKQDDLARKVRQVFERHCYRCHGNDGANEGGFNYVLDRRRLLERRKVVPGEPGRSKLYQLITAKDPDDRMPQKDEALPSEQISLIEKWIRQGADFVICVGSRRSWTPCHAAGARAP